jgi:hypothetical protein
VVAMVATNLGVSRKLVRHVRRKGESALSVRETWACRRSKTSRTGRHSRAKFSKGKARFKVAADDKGIVSHAGTALLRELSAETGLVKGWTAALADTYSLPPTHAPGQVDLARRHHRRG